MPTVLRQDGFHVVVYVKDHGPPHHVHVFGGGGEARIRIEDGAVMDAWRMGESKLQAAVMLVWRHREQLLEAWERIHGHG